MADQAKFGVNTGHADSTQPRPLPGGESVVDGVMKDLETRRQHGITKYGQELLTQNGRNVLLDAYQETLDLAIYLKQQLMNMEIERRQADEDAREWINDTNSRT